MTRVEFDYDRATAIVVPGSDLAEGDPGQWAQDAARTLAQHHEFAEDEVRTLALALERAQQGAIGDSATNVLLFEPFSRTWAPLRLTLRERELDATEQRAFLWPAAVLPPQVRAFDSSGLGPGCSSTVLEGDQRGSVRWLFVPEGAAFFAYLAPVPVAAVALLAATVERMLDTVRIDGVMAQASARFDAASLTRRPTSDDGEWRI